MSRDAAQPAAAADERRARGRRIR